MPTKVRKVNGYRVSTPGGVKSKRTTLRKARAQVRILRGVEHTNWRPTGARATRAVRPSSRTRRSRSGRARPKGRAR